MDNYKLHLDTLKKKILDKKYNLNIDNISVLTGMSSRLVFLAQLGKAEDRKLIYSKRIYNDVKIILEYIDQNQVSTINLEGLVGFGSAVLFINKIGYLKDAEQTILFELDDFIIECARIEFLDNNFDFFYGGLGYLHYLILRSESSPKIARCIEEILTTPIFNKIEENNFSFFDIKKQETIDFSGSHGLASIIYFLNKIIKLGINVSKCKLMLNNCCKYIISNINIMGEVYRIPDYLDKRVPKFSPLRWCHGELGIIYPLTEAAKYIDDKSLSQILSNVLLTISKLKLDKGQELVSPNICHGTLGVAHIFNRLYHLYPLEEVREAAVYWYQKSNEIIDSIGYTDNDDNGIFVEKTGVLVGIEGMALAVLSFIYPNQSDWDYQILLR